jgi:hypothetical protein
MVACILVRASSSKRQASSIKRQAFEPTCSSIKRQASSPEQQAASLKPQAASSLILEPWNMDIGEVLGGKGPRVFTFLAPDSKFSVLTHSDSFCFQSHISFLCNSTNKDKSPGPLSSLGILFCFHSRDSYLLHVLSNVYMYAYLSYLDFIGRLP